MKLVTHYGVLLLREHIQTELSERERREREDWAFEWPCFENVYGV